MVGQVGMVRADLDPTGTVQVANELWTAESDSGEPIQFVFRDDADDGNDSGH